MSEQCPNKGRIKGEGTGTGQGGGVEQVCGILKKYLSGLQTFVFFVAGKGFLVLVCMCKVSTFAPLREGGAVNQGGKAGRFVLALRFWIWGFENKFCIFQKISYLCSPFGNGGEKRLR